MKVIDTKKNSAEKNMIIDANLLDNLKDQPILHFYDWKKTSVTYGYFINIKKFINQKKANITNLDLAKRPTGGGIVFHIWDIAFSFLMPASHKYFYLDPLKNYEFVNSIVLKALKEFLDEKTESNISLSKSEYFNKKKSFDSFCMAKPTKYDVIYKGKKIAGASQRRKKTGYLHQASICLIQPDFNYLKDILIEKDIADAIYKSSYPIFNDGQIDERRKIVKKRLIESFNNYLRRFYSNTASFNVTDLTYHDNIGILTE
ncbi:MAG: Octanoyltransferase LipM, partial [Candidatus Anoxychlamydiales bacterium]|nr:Octanoyltransferase LipM [Candidatus Anoxychlamydiales bacterium]